MISSGSVMRFKSILYTMSKTAQIVARVAVCTLIAASAAKARQTIDVAGLDGKSVSHRTNARLDGYDS